MEISKRVQFLSNEVMSNGLFRYDFLDLESNLTFTVYSTTEVERYKKLTQYVPVDVKFNLVLCKSTDSKGNQKIGWKVKGC